MIETRDERDLARRLSELGCDTGVSRNGRLLRVDNRPCSSAVTSELLDEIVACSRLRDVTLHGIRGFWNQRIDQLLALPRLRTLDLTGSDLSNESLERLQDCAALEVLTVRDTRVTAERVAEVRKRMIGTRIIL